METEVKKKEKMFRKSQILKKGVNICSKNVDRKEEF